MCAMRWGENGIKILNKDKLERGGKHE